MQAGMSIDQDVLALLDDLRAAGYPVALVSNSFGTGTYDGVDLAAVADAVVISAEVGLRKPDPAIFELSVTRLGVPPEGSVFVDDHPGHLKAAAEADVVVISAEVGIRKPSRRIYAIACERLGVAAEEAVMIDDLQQNLDGAARIGIGGVLHTGASDTRRQLAERFRITA